ncbi:MAG TPA: succinate dehydrogenase cytochrome b subunit [Propionibacteriaceae bacterium]|nr:succinate dehydrogenase cytochrome b subunit [Propionibacteriaceae bacterium]
MATISLTPAQLATRSTVALKALMAVTGLILIGYLLAHMYGNLKIFAGAEAFNEYAHHLRALGEPLLPHTGALWIIRVVLLISVLGHMYAAFNLWSRAHKARGGTRRYYSNKSRTGVQRTYASFTLRWGGVVILLFVIYHLLHLTWNIIHPGGAAAEPYDRVVNGFQIWSVVLAYTIAMIAVGFHVRHGTWSALTSLGANTSSLARRRLNVLAYAVAGVVTVGFLLPPFAILFGFVS